MKKIALLMLLLMAAALVVIVVRDRAEPSEVERSIRKNNVFVNFRREDVQAIDLSGPSGHVVLARDASGVLQLTSLMPARVDPQRTDALVAALEFAQVERVVGAFHIGMLNPSLVGKLTVAGVEKRFFLGDQAPTPEGAHYFQVEGEKVVVVSGVLASALLQPAEHYRDRTVMPFSLLEAERIALRVGTNPELVFESRPHGVFVMEAGHARVSRSLLEQFSKSMVDLKALTFPGEESVRSVENQPLLELRVTRKGGKVTRILLGGDCPGTTDQTLLVRLGPEPGERVGMCVSKVDGEPLRHPPAHWKDPFLFSFRFDEVQEFSLSSPSTRRTVEAERFEGGWKSRKPVDAVLDPDVSSAVSSLVVDLTSIKRDAVAIGDAPKEPAAEVTLRGADREERVQLFGSKGAWKVYRQSDHAVFAVLPTERWLFVPDDILFRSTKFLPPEFSNFDRIHVRCLDTNDTLVRQGDQWAFAPPVSTPVLPVFVKHKVRPLEGNVIRWISSRDDGTFEDPHHCRITLGAGKSELVFSLMREDEGEGRYGRIEPNGPVFAASREMSSIRVGIPR